MSESTVPTTDPTIRISTVMFAVIGIWMSLFYLPPYLTSVVIRDPAMSTWGLCLIVETLILSLGTVWVWLAVLDFTSGNKEVANIAGVMVFVAGQAIYWLELYKII